MALLERKVDQLRGYLTDLKQQGTRIVFYELPMDKRMCDQEYFVWARRLVRMYYPDDAYIARPACAGYRTGDGLHLTAESQRKYLAYFTAQVPASDNHFTRAGFEYAVLDLLELEP